MSNVRDMDAAVQSFFDAWARNRHRAFAVQLTIATQAPNGAVILDVREAGDMDAYAAALFQGGAVVDFGGQKDARDDARAGEGLPKQARKPREED